MSRWHPEVTRSPWHGLSPRRPKIQPPRKLEYVIRRDSEPPGNIGNLPVRPLLAGLRDFSGDDAATCYVSERVGDQKRITP